MRCDLPKPWCSPLARRWACARWRTCCRWGIDTDAVVAALRERYAGRGVELVEVAGGLQFRSAPDLAPRLRRVVVVPRRLPRAAMETLAIIAYHQPVTRAEIEQIRGASLSQQTLDSLLELGLVTPKGHKEAPGRPTLWGDHARLPGAVRPAGPARPATPRGPARRAAIAPCPTRFRPSRRGV